MMYLVALLIFFASMVSMHLLIGVLSIKRITIPAAFYLTYLFMIFVIFTALYLLYYYVINLLIT